jgi:S-formylglutathione hydrolase FrmB
MALIQLTHLPETIKVQTLVNLILPDTDALKKQPLKERPVLYLLHGLSDDASAWQRYSAIETYAKSRGIVVVMPSVGRSFYLDLPNGLDYFSYITEELPQYVQDIFGIAPLREKTLVAGLSMGGYGAMKCALLHPERYFAAGSFSGVLTTHGWDSRLNDPRKIEFEYLFGNLSKMNGGQHDPITWLAEAAAKKQPLPKLYVSCGLQDELLPTNRYFTGKCRELGISVEYQEENGIHDWYFWDRQVQRFLDFALGPIQ